MIDVVVPGRRIRAQLIPGRFKVFGGTAFLTERYAVDYLRKTCPSIVDQCVLHDKLGLQLIGVLWVGYRRDRSHRRNSHLRRRYEDGRVCGVSHPERVKRNWNHVKTFVYQEAGQSFIKKQGNRQRQFGKKQGNRQKGRSRVEQQSS